MSQAKRRAGEQITQVGFKADDDNDVGEEDPGEWRPVADASVQNRRKVKARRAGDVPSATAATDAGAACSASAAAPAPDGKPASSNPFSGISLAAPSSASGNPFAGINLQPPTGTKTDEMSADGEAANTEKKKEGAATEAPATEAPATEAPAAEAPATEAPATGSNTFATLASSSETKPFGSWGGGFGSVTGATFGSMFAAHDAKKAEAGKEGEGQAKSLFGGPSLTIPAFSFNTPGASFPLITPTFGSGGKQSLGGDAEGEAGEDGKEGGSVELFNSTADFKPVVSLPVVHLDKVNEQEVEKTIFSADGSLYEFESISNKWKERGKGELRVINADGSAHMVMRQSGHFRLLLNAKVYAAMPVQRMGDVGKSTGLTFACVNAAAQSATPEAGAKKDDEAGGAEAEKAADGDAAAGSEGPSSASTQKLATWAFKSRNVDLIERLCGVLEKAKAGELAAPASQDAVKKGDSLV